MKTSRLIKRTYRISKNQDKFLKKVKKRFGGESKLIRMLLAEFQSKIELAKQFNSTKK